MAKKAIDASRRVQNEAVSTLAAKRAILVALAGGESQLVHALPTFSFDADDFFARLQSEAVALTSTLPTSSYGAENSSSLQPLKLNGIHMRSKSNVNTQ